MLTSLKLYFARRRRGGPTAIMQGAAVERLGEQGVRGKAVASKILRWFGRIWLILAGAFIALNYAIIIVTAPTIGEGFKIVQSMLSPFAISNFLLTCATLAPGALALWGAGRLARRAP